MTQKRILLVDDEESLRITLAANLEMEGFQVVEAESGEHALQLMEGQNYDLMLTDIRMPGINGVDLFRRIRELKPQLPVILMTAFAVEGLVQSALSEGVFTVLAKPFHVGHAVRTLTQAVSGPAVLVVDDAQMDASTTVEALGAVGVRARAVFTGEEALQVVKDNNIDVCVIDLVMPGLNGAQVVEKLRVDNPNIVAIVVSGHTVPALVQQAAASQAFTCLKKPFSPAELIHAIATARGQAAER